MINIFFSPFENVDNKFIELSKEAVVSTDCNLLPYKGCFTRSQSPKRGDTVLFNWFESLGGNCRLRRTVFLFVKRIIELLILKTRGVKIISVFHNKKPHNTGGGIINWHLLFTKLLFSLSDRIIILSKDSKRFLNTYLSIEEIDRKIFYIPHPNYIGVYGENDSSRVNKSSEILKLLFVGQISAYKNTDLIVRAADALKSERLCFNIYGKCNDPEYIDYLIARSKEIGTLNVHVGFVPDDEVVALIKQNDIMILPYDTNSSMNSGTVFLAFSNRKTVICPNISSVKEFDDGYIYSYDYTDKEDHYEQLLSTIKQVYSDWLQDKQILINKGNKLFDIVEKNNSIAVLANRYKKLFEEIY